MKIALISAVPVFPPFGGNRSKILQLIRILEDIGHQVHFILMPSRQIGEIDEPAHAAHFGERFHWLARDPINGALYYARRAVNQIVRRALKPLNAKLGANMPLDEIYFWPFTGQLRILQERHRFDAAIVEYVMFCRALDAFPDSVLKIIDTLDSQSHRLSPQTEARGFRRADVVLAVQDDDAAMFREQIGANGPPVAVVSHISDLTVNVPPDPCEGATFVGSDFEANLRSLTYFLDQVLPLIRARRHDFRLFVAGSICDRIGDTPGVVRLGRVPHLSDAFSRGPISVNPITAGTGVKIKLLESMAMGVPVVTTAYGVKGVAEAFTRGVVQVPDGDAAAFADAVLDLYGDAAKRRALGGLARQSAASWNQIQISNLVRVLETRAV
jgi:glycosyltransferase involved in cell wall biosynthesis